MPVGVEMLGRPFSEPDLLKLAFAFEQATHHRHPPALTPRCHSPSVAVASAPKKGMALIRGLDRMQPPQR